MTTSPAGSDGKIRIGIIGASADPFQWGAAAHIPALRSLPEYEVVAVGATRQETADAAAAAHVIPMAFGNVDEMMARPDIDMICICTSVMHHRELATAAIMAGKHVFCEWPLGMNTNQAAEISALAAKHGTKTLVGLQSRCAPIVAFVHDLLADGYVGTLMSVNLARANDQLIRMELPESWTYFLDRDKANGGMAILGGHALDTLAAYVGEFTELQAYTEVMCKQITVAETGLPFEVTAPDHIFVQGKLKGGAVASVVLKMNSPMHKAFHLEISGSKGALIVSSAEKVLPGARHAGVPDDFELLGSPTLAGQFSPIELPEAYRKVPRETPCGQPFNVAHLYRRFSEDLRTGSQTAPDFVHGVARHRLLDTIQAAADHGTRRQFSFAARPGERTSQRTDHAPRSAVRHPQKESL